MKKQLVKTWDLRFPCFLEREVESGTYAGFCEGAPIFVAGKPSREAAIQALQEGLAYYLAHLETEGRALPHPPKNAQPKEGLERVWLTPAPVNPVSLEIERLMKKRGVSRSELARRLGVAPSAVTRWLDPLYFGHSLKTLKRIAEALDSGLEVQFVA